MVGIPEALLSDHGKNLLSNLDLVICQMLGSVKLNMSLSTASVSAWVISERCETLTEKGLFLAIIFGLLHAAYFYKPIELNSTLCQT